MNLNAKEPGGPRNLILLLIAAAALAGAGWWWWSSSYSTPAEEEKAAKHAAELDAAYQKVAPPRPPESPVPTTPLDTPARAPRKAR